jgi:hypothetical protein
MTIRRRRRRRWMITVVRSWEEKEEGSTKIRSAVVATIGTREDLTKVVNAKC